MGHVTRYILRQIAGPFALLTLSFTAVAWLTQSLTFVDLIINRGLSLTRFMIMTAQLTPGFLAVILPMALFIAVLHSYHRLTFDSEIMVMRSAGLSQRSIAAPALLLAVGVSAVGYGLTLFVAPLGFSAFKSTQYLVQSDQASVLLQAGEFNSLGNGITVYARRRGAGGELQGLLVHDARNPESPVTVVAERGVLLAGDGGLRFVLSEGNRQQIEPDRSDVSVVSFDEYALDLEVLAPAKDKRWREPAERTLPSLLFPNMEDPDDRRFRDELLAEAHNRLTRPLYALVLAVMAIGAVLSGEFNRRGEWGRIALVSVAAVGFEASGIGLAALAAREPAATPLVYANLAAWLGAAIFALLARRRRRAVGLQPAAA